MKRKAGSYGGPAKRRRTNPRRGRKSRRRYVSRRRPKGIVTKIMREPVPDKMYTRLIYCDTFNLVMTSAGSTGRVSQAFTTSLYDPDYTNFGHQPLWMDQLANMYKKYRVHGIKYILTFQNTNTNQLAQITLQHSTAPPETPISGAGAVNINTIRERRGTRTFPLGSANDRPTTRKGYLRTNQPFGLTKKEFMSDEDFDAGMPNDPAKKAFLNIYATTENSACTINMQVKLVYYVEFQERVLVTGS